MNKFNDYVVMTGLDWITLIVVCVIILSVFIRMFWLWITPPAQRTQLCHECAKKAGDTKVYWRMIARVNMPPFKCTSCGRMTGCTTKEL